MTNVDQWIARYRRRICFGHFLQRAAEWIAGFLFGFGSLVLAAKTLTPWLWPHVLWLGAGFFPVAIGAWYRSRQSAVTQLESVALLDRRLNAGGLLMTLSETSNREWAARLPQSERLWQDSMPKVRPRRFARLLALPLVFALGACLVPLRQAETATGLRNAVGRNASARLEEMLTLFDDAAVFESEDRDQLREEIDKLAEEAKKRPLTHEKWETIDALEDRMLLRLNTSELSVAKAQGAAAALRKASTDGELEFSAERIEQLEKEVMDALQNMFKNGKLAGAPKDLQGQLQRLMKNGELRLSQDTDQRQEFLSDLQEFLDAEAAELAELRQACQPGEQSACPACGGQHQGGT